MRGRPVALAGLVIATGLLVIAFQQPFLTSDFELPIPDWVRKPLAVAEHNPLKRSNVPLTEKLNDWLIEKAGIPEGDQYLLLIIKQLFTKRDGDDPGQPNYALGVVILAFSVVFPLLKIGLAGVVATVGDRMSEGTRARLLGILGHVSKWSMADVFIAALVVVFFKAEGFHYTFEARAGLYCFGASALLSGLVVGLVAKAYTPDLTVVRQRVDALGTRLRAAASGGDDVVSVAELEPHVLQVEEALRRKMR